MNKRKNKIIVNKKNISMNNSRNNNRNNYE